MRKPEEITSYEFKKGRGYKAEEVDDYLRSVSTDYRKLYLENQSLKEKLLLVTRELQDYKDGVSERPFSPQPEEASAAETLPGNPPVEEYQRENLKIRSQLKDTKEQLSQKFEAFRNQYISFMETQLNTIKSDAFSFSMNTELDGLLEKEEISPVEKESVRNHKKSDDLFQMLDHMNQQMKEESDARMLQKIADEVASVQKEAASVADEEKEKEDVFAEPEKEPEQEERKEASLRENKAKPKEEKVKKSEDRNPGEAGKKEHPAPARKKEGRKIPVVKNSSIKTGAAEKKASTKDSGSTSAAKKPKASEFHGEKTLIEKLAEEVEASEAMGQTIVFQPVKTEEASDMDKTIVFQPVHSEKGEA